MDAPDAATAIGISLAKLELLRQNAAFPSPVSDDGAGTVVFDDSAIAVFAWIYRAAIRNGWLIDDAILSSADFAMMATTSSEPSERDRFLRYVDFCVVTYGLPSAISPPFRPLTRDWRQ